ncbi:PilZ domain-containing protein [Alicyclobacillus acidiphilus]|uniref:PilZ domain-containing protein n=1 Tax=Alicyclobacillus acidiphilus TaxID=182455 RepID=UPI0008354BC4|nr:PilZ domain-containing protein [Alicyclobacillus acidiphilus]
MAAVLTPANATSTNRRRYHRFSVVRPTRIQFYKLDDDIGTSWRACRLIDISGGGCKIISKMAMPVLPETVVLNICLGFLGFEPIHARIMWRGGSCDAGNVYEYGLRWIGIEEARREQIIASLARAELARGQKA